VPTFKDQIEKGGPVIVTDPAATRFFMTMGEAAKLVLQACSFLEGSEIFLLDMGEPVPIVELARKMIKLLGNGKPIEIRYSGLRPGEKLHEDLTYRSEDLRPTPHSQIFLAREARDVPEEFPQALDMLLHSAFAERTQETRETLMDLVMLFNHLPNNRELFRNYLSIRSLQVA
jgi:FlaA1/EpsC-like NDP-sugar epimerase